MNYKLYQGDCIDVMEFEIASASVDLVLTDIPYAAVNRKSSGLRNLDKGKADEITFTLEDAVREVVRVCRGSAYIFCATEQVSELRARFVDAGLSTRLCVWEKTNPSPMNGEKLWLSSIECCVFARRPKATFNEHCQSAVWRHSTARGKEHPTMKPVGLMERLILASTHPGDSVLDFTMGSGTTGVAAGNTGRKFIGIELDPGYFEVAERRISAAYMDGLD